MSYAKQLQQAMQQQQQRPAGPSPGANVVVKGVGFHPPGAEAPLLEDVSFHLRPNQLGLVIGRSGSGKTTLLQLLAGLTEQTSGEVFIHRPSQGDHSSGLFLPTHIEQRMQQVGVVEEGGWRQGKHTLTLAPAVKWCAVGGIALQSLKRRLAPSAWLSSPPACLTRLHPMLSVCLRVHACVCAPQVGLVFQFPERHFLGDDVMQEMTFTWPRAMSHWGQRQAMAVRMQQVRAGAASRQGVGSGVRSQGAELNAGVG